MTNPDTPRLRLLTMNQVIDRVPISKPTVYAYIKAGIFPAPIRIGPKSIRFLTDEIDAWLVNLTAERVTYK